MFLEVKQWKKWLPFPHVDTAINFCLHDQTFFQLQQEKKLKVGEAKLLLRKKKKKKIKSKRNVAVDLTQLSRGRGTNSTELQHLTAVIQHEHWGNHLQIRLFRAAREATCSHRNLQQKIVLKKKKKKSSYCSTE